MQFSLQCTYLVLVHNVQFSVSFVSRTSCCTRKSRTTTEPAQSHWTGSYARRLLLCCGLSTLQFGSQWIVWNKIGQWHGCAGGVIRSKTREYQQFLSVTWICVSRVIFFISIASDYYQTIWAGSVLSVLLFGNAWILHNILQWRDGVIVSFISHLPVTVKPGSVFAFLHLVCVNVDNIWH